MEGKKKFFESLEPKSALIVGLVTGILTLCTIGFVILLFVVLGNKATAKNPSTETVAANNPAQAENTPATTAPKSDRPIVELFVMSYCPYGLQMEKAFLPAMELLKGKADLSIKFVSYAMHDLKEVAENTRQYCIETEQADKFIPYMECFTGKDDYKGCLATVGVNEGKMNTCVNATNKKYGTIDKYNDQKTWLNGRFPVYPVHQDLNDKYGVQGSPTLIINGVESSAGRTPEAVKQAICVAFNNQPGECQTTLDTAATSPGFGVSTGGNATAGAACGN